MTTVAAGLTVLQPGVAQAQLLTLNGLANDLTALTTTVTDQAAKTLINTSAITALNTNVTSLTSTVTSQATTLQTVQATVAARAADLATVTANVAAQNTQLTANTGALTTLTGTVGTLTSSLGTLGTTVANQTSALQGLQATVNANAGDLATVSASLGQQGAQLSLNTGALTTLTGTVGTLTSSLGTLTSGLAEQATALRNVRADVDANVATLSGTVGQQATQLAVNTGAIGTLTSGLADQVTALHGVRTDVNANVANVTTLSGTVGQQGTQLSLNTGAIGTLTGSLGTLTTSLADQATALGTVRAAVNANVADLATLTATVNQQAAQAGTNAGVLGTLTSTVSDTALALGTLSARVDADVANVAGLTVLVNQQGQQGADNAGAIDTLAGSVGTLATTVAGAGTQIVRNTTDIGDLRARLGVTVADVGTIQATIGSQGSDIDTANANIASLQAALAAQGMTLGALDTSVAAHGVLLGQQGAQIVANTNAILSLRNMAVTGNVGPAQFVDATAPLVAAAAATNDVGLIGADGVPMRLHNVAAGLLADGSTQAVNGEQLNDTNTTVATLADTVTAQAGNVTTLATTVTGLGTTVAAQGTLLSDQGSRLALTVDALGLLRRQAESASIGPVRYSTSDLPTTPNGGTVTNDLTLVGLDPTAVKLHNVGDGTVDAGSTDAVNGGQLFALARSFEGLSDLAVRYDSVDQDAITLGARNVPVTLRNIRAGTLAAGSTDAINGDQLFQTNSTLATLGETVSGQQSRVYDFGRSVASALGGSFGYDPATGVTGAFSWRGRSFASVQSVFGAIEDDVLDGLGTGGDPAVSAKYFHTNSVEADSDAMGTDSTAIGPQSSSVGTASVALGRSAWAGGDSSVAIGDGAKAMEGKAVSIGLGNVASGDGAVAIGDPNIATGEGATALGKDNTATGIGAIALGNTNEALGDGATSIGSANRSSGLGAAAIGLTNVATGEGAITIGANNRAIGNGSLAIGTNVVTLASDTLAIGNHANASGTSAVAIGNRSGANNDKASALGDDAVADGFYSTAIGASSYANNVGASALGISSMATGYASTAVGSGAVADQEGSVALGSASQTVRGAVDRYTAFGIAGDQQSLGEIAIARNLPYYDPSTASYTPTGDRQITGLAAGSAGSDAVNVSQLRGVSGTLGAAFVGSFGSGARYDDATGSLVGPSYLLNGVTYSNVGDALQALAARTTGSVTTPSGGTSTTVSYDSAAGSDVTLAPGGTAIHNVAPGTVAAGSGDAVNGGQLAETNAQVTQLAQTVANGAAGPVQYADKGTSAGNAGTKTNDVTLVGADAKAAVTLHNVAAGQVAAGSTDAVNGTQLAETNTRVASVETRVATVEDKADQALASTANVVRYDTGSGAVTLGAGSAAVALRNVASGTVKTDAVNLGQLDTAMASTLASANAYTDGRVSALAFDLAKVNRDVNAGTAGAMALAGMPQAFEEGKSMLAMGAGTFQGQSAIALGLSRIGNDGHTIIKVGMTYNSRKQVGANGGVGYQF